MPHFENTVTAIHVVWQLVQSGVSPEEIPKKVGRHRATVYRWISGIRRHGINEFIRRFREAKRGRRRRKTESATKARVYAVREKYRNCCGEKIRYFMQKEYGDSPSVSTIYRILGEKYRLRSKWKKNMARGSVLRGTRPREAVQFDTVDFGGVFAFTSIDAFTKEPCVVLKGRLDSEAGAEAFKEQLEYFGHVDGAQRDGGPEFKGHWDALARRCVARLRTARPYKKNEQAFIERFNGILRKECLGYGPYRPEQIPELQKRLDEFMQYYLYERPHLSLNMQTPNEFAMSHLT
ncbi:MAG: integrase core domain-containing protein [bacterium]